ncbi:unnamed protein product, partial [Heterosigma akashiwo]
AAAQHRERPHAPDHRAGPGQVPSDLRLLPGGARGRRAGLAGRGAAAGGRQPRAGQESLRRGEPHLPGGALLPKLSSMGGAGG